MLVEISEILQPRPDFSSMVGPPCFKYQPNHGLADMELDTFPNVLELDDVRAEICAYLEQIDECTRSIGETCGKNETSVDLCFVSSNQIGYETDVGVAP